MTDWANTNYNTIIPGIRRPNFISYDQYCLGGMLHRLDGPAEGAIYYFAGQKLSKPFMEHIINLDKRVQAMEAQQHNVVIYESFIEALKNAMDDSHTDEVTVSRKLIEAIAERTAKQ